MDVVELSPPRAGVALVAGVLLPVTSPAPAVVAVAVVAVLVVLTPCAGVPLASAAAVLAVCEPPPQPASATAVRAASTAGVLPTRRKTPIARRIAGLSGPMNKLPAA